MNRKILSGGLLLIIMAFSFACNQTKQEPKIDNELIKAEIQAIENRFAATYNDRNADSLTYYAEDAVSYFPGQQPIVGRAAIHQHIQNELMEFPEGAKISFETLEIFVTDDGNNVAEIGAHQLVDSAGNVLQQGHYFSFFAKRDGQYVCTRDMATSVQMDN